MLKTSKSGNRLLITGGCSYSDPEFRSCIVCDDLHEEDRGGWPMWPELVGKRLGLDVINTASSGRGNDYIFNTVLNKILSYKDDIDTVMVMWSEYDRFTIGANTQGGFPILPISHAAQLFNQVSYTMDADADIHTMFNKNHISPDYAPHFVCDYLNNIDSLTHIFESTYDKMICLNELCDKFGIKIYHFNSLTPMAEDQIGGIINEYNKKQAWSMRGLLYSLNKSSLRFNTLNEYDNILGFPFMSELGGFTIVDLLREGGWDDLTINPIDGHPNPAGQEFISKIILDFVLYDKLPMFLSDDAPSPIHIYD
tara:strand:- start:3176 stop:4105 length:930 start_codon:yes stop_codon:yes gene_type:complete